MHACKYLVSFARNDNDVESSVIVFFVVSDVILNGHSTHSDDITDNKELLDDVFIPPPPCKLYHSLLCNLFNVFKMSLSSRVNGPLLSTVCITDAGRQQSVLLVNVVT